MEATDRSERQARGPAPWPRQGVYKAGTGVWFVPSKSVAEAAGEMPDGAYRRVEWHFHPRTGTVYTCTCPAGTHRGQMAPTHAKADPAKGTDRPCRHVFAVQAAERADGYPPRPTAPANVSALVD